MFVLQLALITACLAISVAGARAQGDEAQPAQSPFAVQEDEMKEMNALQRQRDSQVRAAHEQQRRLIRYKKEMEDKSVVERSPDATPAPRAKPAKRVSEKIPCVESGPGCR
jgi:hypothetical protein